MMVLVMGVLRRRGWTDGEGSRAGLVVLARFSGEDVSVYKLIKS